MATEMIKRDLVDLALNNLSRAVYRSLEELKGIINAAWGRLVEERKTAAKNREELYEAADNKRNKQRAAEIKAYKGASGRKDAPSYDSHQQTLASIDAECTRAKTDADNTFAQDNTAAETQFREDAKSARERYEKATSVTQEIFLQACP